MLGTSQLLLSDILSPRLSPCLSPRSSLSFIQSGLQSQSRSRSFSCLLTALSLPHSLTALSTARLQPFLCSSLSQPHSSLPQRFFPRPQPFPQPFPQPQLPPHPPKQDNKRIIHKQFIFFTHLVYLLYFMLLTGDCACQIQTHAGELRKREQDPLCGLCSRRKISMAFSVIFCGCNGKSSPLRSLPASAVYAPVSPPYQDVSAPCPFPGDNIPAERHRYCLLYPSPSPRDS